MTLVVTANGGPLILGPGASLSASSDLLPLAAPPFHWGWDFTGPADQMAHWLQTTTTTNNSPASLLVLWNDSTAPSDLLQAIHFQEPANLTLEVSVRDTNGDLVDSNVYLGVPWQPHVWTHVEQRLWANNIVTRVGQAAAGDKIDQILAAVYQTFPNA